MLGYDWRHRQVDATGWANEPSETWFSRIFGGLIFPVGMMAFGIWMIVAERGWLPTRYGIREYHGTEAVLLGVSCLGLAVFFHGYCLWGPIGQLQAISQVLKFLGALTFIGAFVYFAWSVAWL